MCNLLWFVCHTFRLANKKYIYSITHCENIQVKVGHPLGKRWTGPVQGQQQYAQFHGPISLTTLLCASLCYSSF